MFIFISYSRENKDSARMLIEDIRRLGHSVWIDQSLSGGHAWWAEILSVIRKSDYPHRRNIR